MARSLQTWAMAVPLDSFTSASRSLEMTCSGVCRSRFAMVRPLRGKPPRSSHRGWTRLKGAGHLVASKNGNLDWDCNLPDHRKERVLPMCLLQLELAAMSDIR